MPCLGTTVTVHRVGIEDLSSLTERIIPVTGNPFNADSFLDVVSAFILQRWIPVLRPASVQFL
jgi:hypothetical protein